MATRTKPRHVVVDGSNLATEGRALPSLKQLNDAVLAYMEEHPDDVVTVVVDATFGHRIDPREVPEFDAAVENNELVAPPAGAIGRGDAFVLTIANKVDAIVISNDSYQEFHGGEYDWLFDEGRLIGGKPVPNVGWVFVPRVPVRGPVSRRAVKDAKKVVRTTKAVRAPARASKEASQPMPVPAAPPPGVRAPSRAAPPPAEPTPPAPRPAEQTDAPTATRPHMVNQLLPFLGFVEQHPVGSTVAAVVESYSSHGAYVNIGDARGYVPLRLMADPPPRSARSVMKLGDTVDLVVVSFNATRRSIDLCVPGMEPPEVKALAAAPRPAKRARKKATPEPVTEPELVHKPAAASAPAPAKRSRKKAVAPAPQPEPVTPPRPAPVKRTRKRKAAAEPPAVPVAELPVDAAPATAAPAKRTRKKAAPPAPEPLPPPASLAGPSPGSTEPPTPSAPPAKRTRKKAAAS